MIFDNITTTISNLYKELWVITQDSNRLLKKNNYNTQRTLLRELK